MALSWLTVAVVCICAVADAQNFGDGVTRDKVTTIFNLVLSDYECTNVIRKCVHKPELCTTEADVKRCIKSDPVGRNCDLDNRFYTVFNESFWKCKEGVILGDRPFLLRSVLDLTKEDHVCIGKIQQCFQNARNSYCNKPEDFVTCIEAAEECQYLTKYWPIIHDAFLKTCPNQVKIVGRELVQMMLKLRTNLQCSSAVHTCLDVNNPLASCGKLNYLVGCLQKPCEEIKRHIPVIIDTLFKVCREKDNYFLIGEEWELAVRPTDIPGVEIDQTKRLSLLDEILQLEKGNSVCTRSLMTCLVKYPTDRKCIHAAEMTYCIAQARGCQSLLHYWPHLKKAMEDYCYHPVGFEGKTLIEHFGHFRTNAPVCLDQLKRCFNYENVDKGCGRTRWMVKECIGSMTACPTISEHAEMLDGLLREFCCYPVSKIVVWKYKASQTEVHTESLMAIIEDVEKDNHVCLKNVKKCFEGRTVTDICSNAQDVFHCVAQTDGCSGLIYYWTRMESWLRISCQHAVVVKGVNLVTDLLNAAKIDMKCVVGVSKCFNMGNMVHTCRNINSLTTCMNEVKTCPTLTRFWPVFGNLWKRLCAHPQMLIMIDGTVKPVPGIVPRPSPETGLYQPDTGLYQHHTKYPIVPGEGSSCDGKRRVDETSCRRFYQCQCQEQLVACPKGLYYNYKTQMCDQPYNVQCAVEDATGGYHCPEPNGIFPHEKDCIGYWICFQNKPKRMQCPKDLHFNKVILTCDFPNRANCDIVGQQGYRCPKPYGLFAHFDDCTKFYHCVHDQATLKKCPTGLHFNKLSLVCDLPTRAMCGQPMLDVIMKMLQNRRIAEDNTGDGANCCI